jgi:hypothetical protein
VISINTVIKIIKIIFILFIDVEGIFANILKVFGFHKLVIFRHYIYIYIYIYMK